MIPNNDLNMILKMFDRYNRKTKTNPKLYASTNRIDVYLPVGLKQYANAASGNHGYKQAGIPKGIRKVSDNPVQELNQIFSSVDNLHKFIISSHG